MRNQKHKKNKIYIKWSVEAIIFTGILIYALVSYSYSYEKRITAQASEPIPMVVQGVAEKTPTIIDPHFDEMTGVERFRFLQNYLSKTDLTNEEVNNLIGIAKLESCRDINDPKCFDLKKTPVTYVKHCKRPNGTFYAVEITKGKQADCGKDQETMKEKSWGIFQILETTWKREGCTGNIRESSAEEQADCAVIVYQKEGYNAWYYSAKSLNLL